MRIAARPDVIFCSFGDMLRVPGSRSDLLQRARPQGGDVRVVYSPLDAVAARADNIRTGRWCSSPSDSRPPRPANAMAVLQAQRARGSTISRSWFSHVLVPPAMEAILASPGNRVQGFLAAGHVCTVMGYWEYEPIAEQYRVPIVVTGFEPLDLLQGIWMSVQAAGRGPLRASRTSTRAW